MSTASSTVLEPDWFTRPTCVVAADLVGKVLCRELTDSDGQQKTLRMRISETEAYMQARERRAQRLCMSKAVCFMSI